MEKLLRQPNLQSIAIKSASLPTSTAPAFTLTAWAPFRVAHLTICWEIMRDLAVMMKVVVVVVVVVVNVVVAAAMTSFAASHRMCI